MVDRLERAGTSTQPDHADRRRIALQLCDDRDPPCRDLRCARSCLSRGLTSYRATEQAAILSFLAAATATLRTQTQRLSAARRLRGDRQPRAHPLDEDKETGMTVPHDQTPRRLDRFREHGTRPTPRPSAGCSPRTPPTSSTPETSCGSPGDRAGAPRLFARGPPRCASPSSTPASSEPMRRSCSPRRVGSDQVDYDKFQTWS